MKAQQYNLTVSALLVATGTAVYGQNTPSASSEAKEATDSGAAAATQASLDHAGKFSIRFEGTDLHVGSLPPVTFHGFASQGFIASTDYDYLAGETTDGSFEFNEFGLNASISPWNRTRISAQGFMFDLGNVGNYHPALDYGIVDYNSSNALGVRGGRVRRPSGIYNHIQDIDLARTYVLLPQAVYDARWRDWGGSLDGGTLYGSVNLGRAGSLSYEAFGGLMNLSQEGGIARQFQNMTRQIGADQEVHGCPMYGAQLWWSTPLQGLRAGAMVAEASGLEGDWTFLHPLAGSVPARMEVDSFVQQYSLEYSWKAWTLQAECFLRTTDFDSKIGPLGGAYLANEQYTARPLGWYVSAAYRFSKTFEAGAYYTEDYENNPTITVASDEYQKDLALAFRFDLKPWWILKLEGHSLKGTALLRQDDLNPVRNGDNWWMMAVKTTFSF